MGYGFNHYSDFGSDVDWGKIGKTLLWIIGIAFFLWYFTANAIITEDAVARFAEEANVPVEQIVVVRQSNSSCITGDCRDVTFEMMVDDKPVQGRCTSGLFSPMICRLYTGGD